MNAETLNQVGETLVFELPNDADGTEIGKNRSWETFQMFTFTSESDFRVTNFKGFIKSWNFVDETFVEVAGTDCEGPATSSSRMSQDGRRLSVKGNELAVVDNDTTATNTYLCK